jgi:hypothetical protein
VRQRIVSPMNSANPFSATQQRLILCAAALFVLVACGNLVKNYHPRFRRGRLFRSTPLALIILAAVVAIECVVVVYAIQFVPRHPLWFPGAAAFGLLLFSICAQVDASRAKALAEVLGTTQKPKQWQLSDDATVRLARWCAGALACSLVTVPFSLCGELFGPRRGIIFAIIAFLLSMAVFILARQSMGIRFLKQCPTGLSGRFAKLLRWRKSIERLLLPIGLLAFLSVAAMFGFSRTAGVPADDLPVFAAREHYVLTNHGRHTEVSAFRFRVASASGLVAWHSGALFVSLLALYALLYGELPPKFKREFKTIPAQKRK